MGRTKTLEAFFNQGAQRTRAEEKHIGNDKQSRRPLVTGTLRNYKRAMGLVKCKFTVPCRLGSFVLTMIDSYRMLSLTTTRGRQRLSF